MPVNPPNLDGWDAWCEACATHRPLNCMKEGDQKNGEVYYDYVCSACFTIVLNIHRSNPQERERLQLATRLN